MNRHQQLHERDGLADIIDDIFPRLRAGRDDDGDEETSTTKKAPVTVVRTKYRTLSATFSGSTAGYSTRRRGDSSSTTIKSTTTLPQPPPKPSPAPSETSETSETSEPQQTPDDPPETTSSLAMDTSAFGSTNTDGTRLPAASESVTATPPPSSGGMSAGAVAGIVVGVILGLAALAGLVFMLLKKRKQKEGLENLDDEKAGSGPPSGGYVPPSGGYVPPVQAAAAAAAVPAAGFAARDPNMRGHQAPAGAPVAAYRNEPQRSGPTAGGSAWERPMTGGSQNKANPFGAHAELANSRPSSPATNGHTAVAAAVAGGIGAAAGVAAARGMQRQASRNHGQKHIDLTLPPGPAPLSAVPPSPARTEYSMNSAPSSQQAPYSGGAAAIAAAGGPPGSAVYRVQLDFDPTLEDELGLKAGQLVRMLHEYDDGWALCIRLDRSKQGVVPRTCLSTRPVKPRASPNQQRPGPPVNPSGHHMAPHQHGSPPPQGQAGRPTTPSGQMMGQPQQQASPGPRYQPMPPNQRPHTPSGSVSPAPRTMSPAPGPLSAPIPAPLRSPVSPTGGRSTPGSLTPVEESPVASQGPVLAPIVFTPLPAHAPSEPIGALEAPVEAPVKAPTEAPVVAPAAPVEAPAATPAPAPSTPVIATPPAAPASPVAEASAPPASPAAAERPFSDSSASSSQSGAPKRKPVPGTTA